MNDNFVLRRPKVLSIDVTYHCNLHCRMCNVWQLPDGRKPLSAEQIIDTVFAYHRQHGTSIVRFLGGEPLLREDMPEIIGAVSGSVTTLLVTNGTPITDDVARALVRSGLHELRISIDGPEGIHDWLRGQGSFAMAVAGLDRIRAAKVELESDLPHITVWQCVSRNSAGTIKSMLQFAHSKGVAYNMHCMVDGPPQTDAGALWDAPDGIRRLVDPSDICLTVKERRQLMVDYFDMLAEHRNGGLLATLRTRLGGRARLWFSRFGSLVYRDCSRSMHQVLINPRGEYFTCEFLHKYVYGNCVTDGTEAWGSEKHMQLRRAVRSGQLAACRECNRFGQYRSRHGWLRAAVRLLRRVERTHKRVSLEESK